MAKSMVRKKWWGRKQEVKNKRFMEKKGTYNSIFKPRQLPLLLQNSGYTAFMTDLAAFHCACDASKALL
jgi:hypothetical protein